MQFPKMFDGVIQYFTEAIARIFSPNSDKYPNTGIQPFEGEPLSDWIDNT